MPPEHLQEMSESDIFRLPVLPEVLLQCSTTFRTKGFEDTLLRPSKTDAVDIIQMDAALLLRMLVLEAGRQSGRKGQAFIVTGKPAINDTELIWSQSVISSQQYTLNDEEYSFLKQHWIQAANAAFLMKALAEKLGYSNLHQAQLCGLLMHAGKLLLLSDYSAAEYPRLPSLYATTADPEEEAAHYGLSNNRLLGRLLKRLDVPAMLTNAIMYQDEEAGSLVSAPLLSRLQWVTKALVGQNKPEGNRVSAAAGLIGLEINELMALRELAAEDAMKLAAEWQIETRDTTIDTGTEDCTRHVTGRFHAMALSALLKVNTGIGSVENGNTADQTKDFIEKALVMSLGSRGYLLMRYQRETESLCLVSSNLEPELVSGLTIPCHPDSKEGLQAARCFLQSEPVSDSAESLATVLDKQLLSGLGTSHINSFPLVDGEKQAGVLLAGSNELLRPDKLQHSLFLGCVLSNIARRLLEADSDISGQAGEAGNTQPEGVSGDNGFMDQRTYRNMVHEVNNPLSIIKNYLQLLGLKLKENEAIQDDLKVIDSEIGRVGKILKSYREGNSPGGQGPVNLNEQVENITRVISASLDESSGITLGTDLESGLGELDCDQDKLRQIITNLVKNAVEALADGGKVTVSTGLEIDMSGNEYLKLTISDSGPGLKPEIRKNLFQHGHSTKGTEHSGSGLAITRGLVEEMNGTINCQSSGKGTSFSLLWPVNQNLQAE